MLDPEQKEKRFAKRAISSIWSFLLMKAEKIVETENFRFHKQVKL